MIDMNSDKQKSQRVVITGYGGITATGYDLHSAHDAIKNGISGVDKITKWDINEWKYSLGAEIKNYQANKMISDRKLLKMISRQDVIGLYAVDQAVQHSQLLTHRQTLADATEFNDRTGIFVGSPGNKFEQQYDFMSLLQHANGDMKKFAQSLFEHVNPMWLLKILPNNVLAYAGIQNGFKGPNENITNHGVSGMQAINEAYKFLQAGVVDRALVVGYDTALEPQAVHYYGGLGALSKQGVLSFDATRDGTVLGEGAGAMVLENLESARARGATIYGEILGGATTSEAMGVFAIEADGNGVSRLMQEALLAAKKDPKDIGIITAHANGMPKSDLSEALAISNVFKIHQDIPVTGFKWSIGHTIAAAGVIESLLTLLALQEKTVPGIATLQQPAEECAVINVSSQAQPTHSNIGMVISRGFSSMNSCLVLTNEIKS